LGNGSGGKGTPAAKVIAGWPNDGASTGLGRDNAPVQDTWKITRRLTLDYGIRYDHQTYLKEERPVGGREFCHPSLA
jgi:outer membrane receptor protein involved in Fe transport